MRRLRWCSQWCAQACANGKGLGGPAAARLLLGPAQCRPDLLVRALEVFSELFILGQEHHCVIPNRRRARSNASPRALLCSAVQCDAVLCDAVHVQLYSSGSPTAGAGGASTTGAQSLKRGHERNAFVRAGSRACANGDGRTGGIAHGSFCERRRLISATCARATSWRCATGSDRIECAGQSGREGRRRE